MCVYFYPGSTLGLRGKVFYVYVQCCFHFPILHSAKLKECPNNHQSLSVNCVNYQIFRRED